jgi:drug/metabolite transporter (DMT)-like permease
MKQNYIFGISAKLLNCLLFSIMTLLTLHSTDLLPLKQVLFLRSVIGTLVCIVILFFIKQPISFKLSSKNLLFYFSRAFVSFIAMQLWIFAINHIGINEATAISYTGPFWIFLAARYVMKESINFKSLMAISINMIGVIIILKPNIATLSVFGIGASVTSILLWVLYETICKKQTSDQHYMLQTFYVFLMATIIIAPFAITKWQPVSFEALKSISLLATLSVFNVTAIFIAYAFAPMMVISPFSYARLVFTAILTNLVYHTVPHVEVFIGSGIILIANCCFTYYSCAKKKEIEKKVTV